jgi:hypothetical protein
MGNQFAQAPFRVRLSVCKRRLRLPGLFPVDAELELGGSGFGRRREARARRRLFATLGVRLGVSARLHPGGCSAYVAQMSASSLLASLGRDRLSVSGFAARCALAEQIETLMLRELELAVRREATQVLAYLDAADQRFFARVRARLARGMFTRAGLARSLQRHAEQGTLSGYAPLDLLFAGLFDAGELPDELPQTAEMVAYQPAPGRVILSLLEEVRDDDVVYDLGSGLGRVVLCVALLTAARAIGVEFQPSFCSYARRAAQQVNAHADFLALDARDAHLDDGTLFFLYTPFRGALLRSVLDKLHTTAAQRAIRVCTFGPCTAEVHVEPWLRLRGESSSPDQLAIFDSVARSAAASCEGRPRVRLRRVGRP